MNKLNNKSGFTLIEIIVVLIIVGILASIALPNLFSNVAKSRSAEGLILAESLKTQYEGCVQSHVSTANAVCAFAGTGGITDPSSANTAVTISTAAAAGATIANVNYAIKAASKQDATEFITLTRAAGGAVTCVGSGQWLGVC